MIIVKMLGGAKKVFDSDGMNIDMDGITVAKLLDVLDGLKPKGSEGIEPKNTLVAINGSEISALGGILICSNPCSIRHVGLDGGIVQGTESTIIDATGEQVRVLRKGRIGVKEVQDAWQD